MNELKLSFLGPTRVEINGRAAEIQRRRGTALLAYLAVMGEPQPRDSLAALFWPESDHARGHKALRRDLSELNLALESQWLEIDRESIGLRAGTWVDVAHFQQQLTICANHPAACRTALMQAASLYRGDFLSGFTLADSPPFDEWQFFQSEHLRREFASALEQLVEIESEQGEDDSAMAYARRWISLDPLHEAAHRRLMQLYVQSDERAAALRQYESLRQLLADELDVLPAPETTALYQQIRAGKSVATDAKTRHSAVEAAPRHNLPTQTTAFIGREQELADIQRLLNGPECRLLALVGPGGIGKTRLALAAAAQALDSYANGVFFVSLAPLNEVAYIVAAIAEALHFTFYGTTDSKEQLLAYLSKRHLLLVLDNFEHLLEGAGLLAEILGHAADVTLLVTSRERLKLREEWSYDLQGLAFPANPNQTNINQNSSQSSDLHAETLRAETLTTYSAVQLFLQRARQAEASFVPSPEDIGDIVRICQLVEGMPLGLELAAPWIRSLSCHDIGVEIERSLDFLTATLRNIPERHRSLRAVFGQTWQRLSPAEQAVLRQLSVFRGGCTREAAEEVTQATLGVLSSLVDKALVRRMNTGRYELHELVRQNAAEQLVGGGEIEAIRRQHAEYYLALSEAVEPALLGAHREVSLARLEVEHDNVRAALAWTQVDVGRREAGLRLVAALAWFWVFGNHVNEARGWYAAALQRNSAAGGRAGESPRPSATAALAKAHWGAGMMALVESDYPVALTHLEESVNIARQILDRPLLAIALRELGYLRLYQGDLAAAHRDCEESVALGREVSGQWDLALALHNLGHVADRLGDHIQARALFEECRSLFQVVQDPWGVANSLLGLGLVACGRRRLCRGTSSARGSAHPVARPGGQMVAHHCTKRVRRSNAAPRGPGRGNGSVWTMPND